MSQYGGMGQFGGWLNNYMSNQYNNQVNQWQQSQSQYDQDMQHWEDMNQYQQDNQNYNAWGSGQTRSGPMVPQEKPNVPSPYPMQPQQFDFGGFGGGGGFNPTAPPGGGGFNYGAFGGSDYQAPAGWVDPGIDTAQMVDPSQLIASAQPGITEKMNTAFADAGSRFGSSGMVGTPYSDSLGAASRGAANDIAHITDQYTYQAAESAANREQARAMAEYQANQAAWAQSGMWENQGQLAQMNQDFNAWGQMGDWQNQQALQGGDLANQQWMAQNNWGFQDYQNQQNMMQQFLPMLMQSMGGGY